jgi:hypothetical protein
MLDTSSAGLFARTVYKAIVRVLALALVASA